MHKLRRTKKSVKTSEMDANTREDIQRVTKEARVQLRAQVQLLSQLVDDERKTTHVQREEGGILAELLKTAAAKAPAADGKLVGIVYDPKLAGEPTHRPMVRTCPVRDNYPSLIETVLKRHPPRGRPDRTQRRILLV